METTYNKEMDDYLHQLADVSMRAMGKDALVFTEITFVNLCKGKIEDPLLQLQALVQAGFVRQNRTTSKNGTVHFTYNLTTNRNTRLLNLKKSIDELNYNIAQFTQRHANATPENQPAFAQSIKNMNLGLSFITSAQKFLENK